MQGKDNKKKERTQKSVRKTAEEERINSTIWKQRFGNLNRVTEKKERVCPSYIRQEPPLPSLSDWSLALLVIGNPGSALGQVAAYQLASGLMSRIQGKPPGKETPDW